MEGLLQLTLSGVGQNAHSSPYRPTGASFCADTHIMTMAWSKLIYTFAINSFHVVVKVHIHPCTSQVVLHGMACCLDMV